jgi:hypothetical protein
MARLLIVPPDTPTLGHLPVPPRSRHARVNAAASGRMKFCFYWVTADLVSMAKRVPTILVYVNVPDTDMSRLRSMGSCFTGVTNRHARTESMPSNLRNANVQGITRQPYFPNIRQCGTSPGRPPARSNDGGM